MKKIAYLFDEKILQKFPSPPLTRLSWTVLSSWLLGEGEGEGC
jgi:hypothetical protein